MAAVVGLALVALLPPLVDAFDVLGRWGQATTLVNDVLFIQGGKSDEYNQFGYDTAPATNDVLYLSLSNPFSATSPPWDYVGGSSNSCSTQGPAVAWHTLSAYQTSGLLLFGGEPSPGDAFNMTGSDSASQLDVFDRLNPSWTCEASNWANEPMRRIRHSTGEFGGRVWIIGGEKADGSGEGLSDHWVFDPSMPAFSSLAAANGPGDIYGHASIMLEDGRLVVFGGYTPSTSTLQPLDAIWVLDTTQSSSVWTSPAVSTSSNMPAPRIAFAATSIGNGRIIIHGGSDHTRQSLLNDGWILDTTQSSWTWTPVSALSQIGARTDHFAVHYGNSVVFGFGYTSSAPADTSLIIYDIPSSACVPSYAPPPSPTFATTLPGQSTTISLPTGWGSNSGSETMPSATGSGSGTGTKTTGSSTTGHGGTATQSGGSSTSTSGTGSGGQSSGHGSGSGSDPGSGPGSPDSASGKHSAVAIALGIVFGILGLVVGVFAAGYYLRRRRAHAYSGLDEDWSHLVGDNGSDGGSPTAHANMFAAAPPAASRASRIAPGFVASLAGMVGLGGATAAVASQTRRRRDMLADEDASEYEFGYNPYYDVPRRHGSGSSGALSTRSRRARPTISDFVHGSLASLRTAGGAMLGVSRRSREPSARSEALGEKDPFADSTALVGGGYDEKRPERPRGGRQFSSASSKWSYNDPFADREVQSDGEENGAYIGAYGTPVPKPPTHAAHPPLPPLYEVMSSMSGSASSQSHGTGTDSHSTFSRSRSQDLVRSSLSHDSRGGGNVPSAWAAARPTSILDANSPPAAPMRRSDSWWSRFAGKSFLDRRSSVGSSTSARPVLFEFRDPMPAPRLGAIEEGEGLSQSVSPVTPSPEAPPNRRTSGRERTPGQYAANARHRQSASSLQTTKTADSAALARLGGDLVVVQREDTGSSTHSRASTSSGDPNAGALLSKRPSAPMRSAPSALSIVISNSSHSSQPSERATIETLSPVAMHPDESLVDLSEPALPPPVARPASPRVPASPRMSRPSSPRIPPPSPRGPRAPTLGGGNVLSRIQAFEHAASLEAVAARSPTAPPPGERSTRKLEHRPVRPGPAYGLVQKPELFVANPDRSASLNSGRSDTPP